MPASSLPASQAARPLALITGASSGIGAVFARRLAPTHDLLLVARRTERLAALGIELQGTAECRVEVWTADLGVHSEVARLAERIASDPRLALVVNNAGFGLSGAFWEGRLADLETMQRLHIDATLALCHAALRNFVPRNAGAIINVASVAAFIRGAGSGTYAATKAWMTSFTEGLYLDLRQADSQVVVQALCPGFTYSEFHDVMGIDRRSRAPLSFWLTAESVVAASLEGLEARTLYVIPGWRYRLLTAVIGILPHSLRLSFESARKRSKTNSPK